MMTPLAATIFGLLFSQAAFVTAAGDYSHDKKGIGHRQNLYKARMAEASERIKRAQVNGRALPKKHGKRGAASATFTTTSTAPTATASLYIGRQNDTSACSNQATSDGCTDPVYTVSTSAVVLTSGTLQAGGHVNFQYIPYSQYTGTGSYRAEPSTWTPTSCGLNFDPNNNQPGGAYIGKTSFPFSAACTLPSTGYCIIWVQYSDANQHYGEGGQGPVCFPGTSAATSIVGSVTSTSISATATSTSKTSSSTSSSSSSSSTSSKASTTSSSSSTTSKTSTSTSSSASATSSTIGIGPNLLYAQCAGIGFTGSLGCVSGLTCTKSNDYYSQCLSSCANSYNSQCGGSGYTGTTCCPAPYTCKVVNAWYYQCQA